jgi:hypothetical protein
LSKVSGSFGCSVAELSGTSRERLRWLLAERQSLDIAVDGR